ncbi:MAG: uL15m family ribosomal protein, partial [Rothia sp. (in: high G+C Gram-positive bacteria)]|nr:uL15m family ribosomal protein [Rothia sp. (in: high G+C Gram-positive bacteria)]
EGGDITVDALVAAGAVRKNELVKVLGTGEISAAYNVTVDKVSESAKAKVEAAGGSVTVK